MASRLPLLALAALLPVAAGKRRWPPYDEFLSFEETGTLVGRGGEGKHHWMPSVFHFAPERLLVRVKVDDDQDCGCGEGDRDVARIADPCFKPCHRPGFVDYTTVDGGGNFSSAYAAPDGGDYFCGEGSVGDGDGRMCPVATDSGYEASYWIIDHAGNVVEDGKREALTFTHSAAVEAPEIADFGPSVAHGGKTYWLLRLTTGQMAVYTSTAAGLKWAHLSFLPGRAPTLAGATLTILKGDTLIAAVETSKGMYTMFVSRTTGRHWSKDTTQLPEGRRMPMLLSSYYSTLVAGEGYYGGIVHQKSVPNPKSFAKSRRVWMVKNHTDEPWSQPTLRRTDELYSSDFTKGEPTLIRACEQAPYESFCESSGVIGMAPINQTYGEYHNRTALLVCYDKLADGWTGPSAGKGPSKNGADPGHRSDEIWCRKVRLSDEQTVARKLEKQAEAKERKEKREQDDKDRKEKEKRRKEEKEALMADLEERWAVYNAQFEAAALPWMEYDGELVVIKDQLPDEFAGSGFEDEI